MDVESFSKTKAMELPRNVVVGHDAVHQVGEVCQSLKLGKRVVGLGTWELSRHTDAILRASTPEDALRLALADPPATD